MVNMSSGMDHGRVRPTMTKNDYVYVAQHGGHSPVNKPTESSLLTCSWLGLNKHLGDQNEPTSAKLKS